MIFENKYIILIPNISLIEKKKDLLIELILVFPTIPNMNETKCGLFQGI